MKKGKLVRLVQLSVLTAIVVLMSLTPIGYLKVGILSIALVIIPVVTGAIVLGPLCGAFLGLVFGLTSFFQCFGMDAFGTMLFSINGFYTFIMCVVSRVLTGFLCGLIFKGLNKADKTGILSYSVSSLSGAVLNTVFFMSSLILLFGKTKAITDLLETYKVKNLLALVVAMVGVNGIVEAVVCLVIGTALSKTLVKVNDKMRL